MTDPVDDNQAQPVTDSAQQPVTSSADLMAQAVALFGEMQNATGLNAIAIAIIYAGLAIAQSLESTAQATLATQAAQPIATQGGNEI